MRTLAEFTKTTLIGGILIILPIYVSILLLLKALSGLLAAVKPITAGIPAAVEFKQLLAILVLVAICFIMGLIVRTGPGLRAKNAFEEAVLSKLPGYTLLRGLAGRIAGRADEPTFTPALVEIEEALVPALIIEELEDGSYTVLVPSVPTPMAGALVHPAKGASASSRCIVYDGSQGFHQVGHWRGRVRTSHATHERLATRQRAHASTTRPSGTGACSALTKLSDMTQ